MKKQPSQFLCGNNDYKNAYLSITDLNGKEIKRLSVSLHKGMNETLYEHGLPRHRNLFL